MSDPFEGLKFVDADGVSLAYREAGSGDPVVFLHGSGSDVRTWTGQVDAIGKRHRAIAYSRRYARPNDQIEDGADDQMLPHVDDLVGLLGALDLPSAHLVGHSWGGFIALLTAIRHPARVRSVVLMEPPVLTLFVSPQPRPSEILRLFLSRPATALAIARFGVSVFERARKAYLRGDDEAALQAFGRGVLGDAGFERLSDERMAQVHDNQPAARAQILGEGFPPLRDEDVRGVTVPALLLLGEESPAIFRRLTDRLAELLPDSERGVISGASHLMHEDNPLAVSEIILDFLERRSRGGG
jgi:pimeloyl-ACP methyl ester carboxylesterase